VRDDLMKMIVHDLKTPLTTVLGTLEMLGTGDFGAVTETQRRAIRDCEGKADELLALINDLLEIARLEEANLPLEVSAVSPRTLVDEMMHEWAMRFQQEGARVTAEVAPDAPRIEADLQLLKRVLANLLQNALTHSGHAVELRIAVRREADGALFTVADNGPGIPPEYHELIFRKFERGKNPNVPRVRSSGLGLAFCRLVAEAHGGKIWVTSSEGRGSAFHLLLPLHPPPAPAAADA
jgi:two-component system sensor histidine kinase/response regulator